MKQALFYLSISFMLLLVQNTHGQVSGNDTISKGFSNDSLTIFKATTASVEGESFQIHTPNTYSLGRYGDIPVSYSTGVPNINLPLMRIEDKDLSLDISLSYHASGIKVDEAASWVGLGWSLNAGGIITRVLKGQPDTPWSDGTLRWSRTSIPDYAYPATITQYGQQVVPLLSLASNYQTDNEPDIFYYNFAGHTGKFFFDADMNVCFTDYQDFRVQFMYNASDVEQPYFIITDDAGIRYEFKEYEMSNMMFPGFNFRWVANAWYLTRITSPSGGEINLTYRVAAPISYNYNVRDKNTYFVAINPFSTTHSVISSVTGMQPQKGTTIGSYGVVLKEITAKCGNNIKFKQIGTSRQDTEIGIGDILHSIEMYDTQGGNLRKSFSLAYGYFQSGVSHRSSINFLNYRLRLESITEMSEQNVAGSKYKFEYYNNDDPNSDDAYMLPYRLSPCQDHWGYYNYSYNATIFPNNPQGKFFNEDEWFLRFMPDNNMESVLSCQVTGGGNREPHAEAVKAGTLKKITYPTGGTTTFDFEVHGYTVGQNPSAGGLRIKQISTTDGQSGITTVKKYSYSGGSYESRLYPVNKNNPYYTRFFQNNFSGSGRPDLMDAFGIPSSVYSQSAHVLRVDCQPQAVLGAGAVMTYEMVVETIPGNGRTEYQFTYADDWDNSGYGNTLDGVSMPGLFYSAYVTTMFGASNFMSATFYNTYTNSLTWPYPQTVNPEWKRGQLSHKAVFSESGTVLRSEDINYDLKAMKAVPGYCIGRFNDIAFVYARYYIIGGNVRIKKETIKEYLNGNMNLETINEYDYNSSYHKKVTEQRVWSSNGNKLTTKYYYPTEYTTSLFTDLKNNNILLPVDIRTYKDNKLISGKQIQYNSLGKPLIEYLFEPTVNDMPFNSSNAFTFLPYVYYTYNSFGLLNSYKPRSEITTVYLWGYNYQYPIAEIKGATYSEVTGKIAETTLNTIAAKNEPTTGDFTTINNLRSQLPNAQVTTYTYKPLVGMQTMTDPRGVVTKYDYDNFGRLNKVTQADKVIETYNYNYKN